MSHPRFHFVQAHGKVLLFTLLISLSFPIGSALTAVLDPLVVTWARYLLAALTFVILQACQRRLVLPSLRDLGRYTLISLPALCYFVAMFASMLILQRRISWSMAFALLGGMVAAALIIFRGELSQLASLSLTLTHSNRIYLLGCVGMALNPILVKRYYRGESFAHLTCWTLICATLLLTLVAAPRLLTTDWLQVSLPLWLGLAYLALFATAISFFLFQQGSVVLQPEQVSAYTYLIPVLVLLIGMLSGEEVIWRQVGWGVLGVLLTMVVMVLVPGRQARRA